MGGGLPAGRRTGAPRTAADAGCRDATPLPGQPIRGVRYRRRRTRLPQFRAVRRPREADGRAGLRALDQSCLRAPAARCDSALRGRPRRARGSPDLRRQPAARGSVAALRRSRRRRLPDSLLFLLRGPDAGRGARSPRRLIVMFRTVRPDASVADLRDFLAPRIHDVPSEQSAGELYARYGPDKFSLGNRGYLAGVNPLELWLVAYLQTHPDATRSQIIAASARERQESYDWLFRTGNTRKQDVRIKGLVEEQAFDRVLQDWKRHGYPFSRLVPSLATAIGSSGDRPDALATLMGIVLNGGVKQSTTDLESVHFAAGTPYDTEMAYRPQAQERVMSEEVAATLRRALAGVVDNGTGSRVRGVFIGSDGKPLPIGGKTGTGDNRFESFGPGHRLIEARPVDRTATFVFFLSDRLYGTVTV